MSFHELLSKLPQEQDIVLHVQLSTIVYNVMKKMLILVQFVIMVSMSKNEMLYYTSYKQFKGA